MIDTLTIARTRTINPYLTPLLKNYSLRVQEQPKVIRDSGKLEKKKVKLTTKKSTLDVS